LLRFFIFRVLALRSYGINTLQLHLQAGAQSMTERSFFDIWGRRFITVPGFFIAWTFVIATLPLTLFLTFLVDLIRKKQWATTRCLGFLLAYLSIDVAGLVMALTFYTFSLAYLGKKGKARLERWTYWLQDWWGRMLVSSATSLFNMKIEIDEPEGMNKGPLMVFLRHASLPDVTLAGHLFIARFRMKIRHIIKRELLWEPCLDIGGGWVPTFFVRRNADDNVKELAGIRRLMEDVVNEDDGAMIFPEGTRFNPKKRDRVLQKIAEKGDAYLLEKARAFKNVLPPRFGGSLALLEGNRAKAYAVFVGHYGFEAANRAINLLNGSLVNKTIKVKLWKVPFENIPKTHEERIEWLLEHWKRLDDWVETHRLADQKLSSQQA
jgi:1-acyl-sn-glycerol-3-phosphate acyltransferase